MSKFLWYYQFMVTFRDGVVMDNMILRVILDVAESMGGSGNIGPLNPARGIDAVFVDFASAQKLNKWLNYVDSSFGNMAHSQDGSFAIVWIEK